MWDSFDPGDHRLRPQVVGVVQERYGTISDPGLGTYRPRVELALFSRPSRSAIGRWGWGFHTVRGVSTRGIIVFVPGLSELYMYGGTGDGDLSPPGALGSWGSPEGQLPPRARRTLNGRGRADGGARPMGLRLGKLCIEMHLTFVLIFYRKLKNVSCEYDRVNG